MNDFLKRMLIGLTTGYIIVYYGELVFWATPEREGMTVSSNYLLLFFIPLVAIGIYFLALAAGAKLLTNMVVYYVSSALGALMWIASVVMLLRRKSAANADHGNAEPERRGWIAPQTT